MIFITSLSGLLVGVSVTASKFAAELIANGGYQSDPLLIFFFITIAVGNSLFLVFSVNLCMKYYD